ncbi:MAG: hypothetical protein OEV70_11990, partial [Nitrospirota bacterium]|nr:hypothetical protein [Nitrospirota bacterium]
NYLENLDIAVSFDSEYRSSAIIHGGITIQRGFSVCQPCSRPSLFAPSPPLAGTVTGVILLNG